MPAASVLLTRGATSSETAKPDEERRLVTALFCDLVGFTPLSDRLDPEEIRDIQAHYFEAMSAQVVRYAGTIEKYAGDAVLALFGVPVAHEDDPERAVLCALAMQEAIGLVAPGMAEGWDIEARVRIGVNTGEVVSGGWSSVSGQDVAVSGDAVNVAARLQSAAEPGQVLVGAETRQLTRRRIVYGERIDQMIKGKSAPVPVWPALGVREEFGERWEGYETPLVGRDREMLQLLDGWMRAQAGEGQLISVVGDAGVGKSRLIADFLGKVASSGPVRVVRARSLSYGQEVSLWLITDLLRSFLGIKEYDRPEQVMTKLEVGLPALVRDPEIRAESLDVFGEVFGLTPRSSVVSQAGPQIRRRALVRGLRATLAALAERGPVVVVLEDLHWIDAASREVLSEILADLLGLRMLTVVAHRPGWASPWAEWGWPERLTLRPLGEEDVTSLAVAVLGGASLSGELEQYIADRAGGNPFFVEEMLRALVDTVGLRITDGIAEMVPGAAQKLPATLTGVLLARLDRLDADARSVAQVGSVIGRTFPVKLLSPVVGMTPAMLDDALSTLQRAEIVFLRRGAEMEYAFKHVSMRDAAYNTLVQKRRQELHLQTARVITELYPADEYAEMIAYHYSRAGAPEAAEWMERAGDRAASVYAIERAISDYAAAREGLARTGADPVQLARLDEKWGTVLSIMGRYDESLEKLERVAAVYERRGDLEAAGRIVAQIGMTHRYRGSVREGIERVTPLVQALTPPGPSESLASLYLALANLWLLLGEYRRVLEAAERAGEISKVTGNERQLGEAEERRGTALELRGLAGEGLHVIEAAVPLIERGGDLVVLFRALNNTGEAAKIAGQVEYAVTITRRALEVAERIGNPDQVTFVMGNLAGHLMIKGDWDLAREWLARGRRIADTVDTASGKLAILDEEAHLALWTGEWEKAERMLVAGVESDERTDRQLSEITHTYLAELRTRQGRPAEAIRLLEPFVPAESGAGEEEGTTGMGALLAVLAWAHLEAGEPERAEALLVHGDRLSRGEYLYLLDLLWIRGMLRLSQGRLDEARLLADDALTRARTMPHPYFEARLLLLRSRILSAEASADARPDLQAALEIFRRLGANRDAEQVESYLLVAAH